MSMTKKERVRAAVSGQQPDHLPYSLWTHFPGIDLDPVQLADKTVEFYREYDVDVIKTMKNGMYAIEDLGCTIDYSEISKGGVAKVIKTPIHGPEDWSSIQVCDPNKGSLARELYSLERLIEQLKGEEVPVVFTVFSPLTTADKVSNKQLLDHIARGYGDLIKVALEKIATTTAHLAQRALELGADGIFFASQMSNYDRMSSDLYQEYGVPYDLMVLNACNQGWMNTLHAHGNDIMFELLKNYPVQVFNWHIWESLPTLEEGQLLTGKCIMGGLNRTDITHRNKNAIIDQIYHCYRTLQGRNQILTPGCVIRYPLDSNMLHAVRQFKEEIENALIAHHYIDQQESFIH